MPGPQERHIWLQKSCKNAKQNRTNRKHLKLLKTHKLFATGTTGKLLEKECGLKIKKFVSGPLGGDQQIGSSIVEKKINMLIFFWDPLEPMPHDPDIKALKSGNNVEHSSSL